jgi:hypothetical protein
MLTQRRVSPRAIIMEHSDGLFDTDKPEHSVVTLYCIVDWQATARQHSARQAPLAA